MGLDALEGIHVGSPFDERKTIKHGKNTDINSVILNVNSIIKGITSAMWSLNLRSSTPFRTDESCGFPALESTVHPSARTLSARRRPSGANNLLSMIISYTSI